MISLSGYRIYIATHPAYYVKEAVRFSFSAFNLSKCVDIPKSIIDEGKAGISMYDISELSASQKSFVDALRNSYEKLRSDLWNEELELMDVSYNDIPSIIESICPRSVVPELCYVVIGYSDILDNYTILISLKTENSFVDDRFVCRSNSLDKTMRNKLKGKTIIKIQLQ